MGGGNSKHFVPSESRMLLLAAGPPHTTSTLKKTFLWCTEYGIPTTVKKVFQCMGRDCWEQRKRKRKCTFNFSDNRTELLDTLMIDVQSGDSTNHPQYLSYCSVGRQKTQAKEKGLPYRVRNINILIILCTYFHTSCHSGGEKLNKAKHK